jgi:hypothetical protein
MNREIKKFIGLWKGKPIEELTKKELLDAFLQMVSHYEERLKLKDKINHL